MTELTKRLSFQSAQSLGFISTTSPNFITKVSLNTGMLFGLYRLSWSARAGGANPSDIGEYRFFNVTDGVDLTGSSVIDFLDASSKVLVHAATEVFFNAQAKILEIQWRLISGGGSSSIENARMELWRIDHSIQ